MRPTVHRCLCRCVCTLSATISVQTLMQAVLSSTVVDAVAQSTAAPRRTAVEEECSKVEFDGSTVKLLQLLLILLLVRF